MSNKQGDGIRCLMCGEVLYSLYRHDFRRCKCETVFVDGGFDYLRIGYKNPSDYVIVDKDGNEKVGD